MVGAHTHVNTLKKGQLRIRAGKILILHFSHLLKHIYEKRWVAIHIQLIILEFHREGGGVVIGGDVHDSH